jgi:threonine/homoserine/homoserine lactone efflux protein
MHAVPDFAVLASYTLACLVLFITPGPDMSLFLAKTLAEGRRAAVAACLGTSTGCLLHTLLAAVGVSALLAASPIAFTILKIVGAIYLLWLAIGAIRHGSALTVRDATGRRSTLWQSYLTGLGINLTNPKIVLFFVTFLPQFVSADDPHAATKLAFLGVYFVALTLPLGIALIAAAHRVVGALKRRPLIVRALDYLFAGLFGAFAIKVLAMQGR